MNDSKRVVVTGVGAVSALGHDLDAYPEKILRDSSLSHTAFYQKSEDYPRIFSLPQDVELKSFIKKRKSLKIMSRTVQLAVAASRLAFDDAKCLESDINLERAGVSMATGIINYDFEEMLPAILKSRVETGFDLKRFGEQGHDAMFPLWSLKYIPNMPACHISIENNLKGPSNTHSGSNASGFQAIAEAVQVIKRGDADLMLVGSSEARTNPLGLAHMKNQGLLENGDFKPGEAGAAMVLESYEHAIKRRAKIYGEVLGVAVNHDQGEKQESESMKHCFKRALKKAQLDFSEVDFIVLNHCGIHSIDQDESQAIHALLQANEEKPELSMKKYFGYVGHASGILETNLSLKVLNGHQKNILECMSNRSIEKTRTFMINALGLYGHYSSMILRKTCEEVND